MNRLLQFSQPQLRLKYLVDDYCQIMNNPSPQLKPEYMIPDYRELLNEISSPKRRITT